jgi:hypothetical protein
MTEKNFVINIKNKQGTIFTFRGDTAAEVEGSMLEFIAGNVAATVSDLETTLLGSTPDPIAVVQNALGPVSVVAPTQNFAPVPPPAAPAAPVAAGSRMCNHGPMIGRKGNGAKGEWKGLFCPTPKGTADQCQPVWLTRKDPEWATI